MVLVCVCSLRYPACNAHAPYCHLWPAPHYNIFPHYPINEKRFLNCGFSIPLRVRITVYFIRPSLHNNTVQCLYYATNNCATCFDPIVPVPVSNLGSMVYFIRPSLHNNTVQCLYYATNNCATCFDSIVPVPVPNLGSTVYFIRPSLHNNVV